MRDTTGSIIRSKLSLVERVRANGSKYWAARGSVPIRTSEGKVAYERRELSVAGDTAAAREAAVDRLNHDYEQAATVHIRPITFARALENYLNAGHPTPIFAEKIVEAIGGYLCAEINDTVMGTMKKQLFADDAAASYVNRHLLTPVVAVLNMALRERAPRLTRPKGHKARAEGTNIEIPTAAWFKRIFPHLGPDTQAFVAFVTTHGRRLGDALGRRPQHFDPVAGTLIIGKTKNGTPEFVDLHPKVSNLIRAMPGWQERRWLFRDGPTSGSNVRKDLLEGCMKAAGVDMSIIGQPDWTDLAYAACAEAGIAYFSPHEIGRHSFATRLLREGYSLEYVMRAGGWKSIEVVSRLYGHLEKKEWTEAVHRTADSLFDSLEPGGKLGADLVVTDGGMTSEHQCLLAPTACHDNTHNDA